jgi:2-haloalkanoic acid dehalogenase type II
MARAYDWITFDCYGTLVDWEGGITAAFEAAARAEGKVVARREVVALHAEIEPAVQAEAFRPYREVLAITAERMAPRLGLALPRGGAFLAESLARWAPFDDTNEALGRLVAAGHRLGILSNVDDDLLAGTRARLDAPFDLVVTAQQVRSYKPGRAHFDAARAHVAGAPWLHAAQSRFHDIAAARALGVASAWIDRQGDGGPSGADLEVSTLAELADRLGA